MRISRSLQPAGTASQPGSSPVRDGGAGHVHRRHGHLARRPAQRFRVPGRAAVSCPSPGTYVLWNETSTFFEGASYSPGESLPDGMAVTITDAADGRCFRSRPTRAPPSSREATRGARSGPRGRPRGKRRDRGEGKFPDRIFFVRKSVIGRVFASIAGMIVSGAAGFLGAVILAISVFIRRSRSDSCKIRDGPRKQPAVESRYENGEPTRVSPGGAACAGLRSGGPPTLLAWQVDGSKKTPVSPFVYGHNHPQWEKFGWTPTISRAGGNRLTAYNWETNASNAGSDWQHQNDNLMGTDVPGEAIRKGVASSRRRTGRLHREPSRIVGASPRTRTAAATSTGRRLPQQALSRPFSKKDGALADPPDPADGRFYQDEFV